MTERRFYWDEYGVARAELPSSQELLVWFLEEDVQASVPHCDELLALCEQGARQGGFECSQIGNAHKVIFRGGRVTIENLFIEEQPPYTLSLDEFRDLLQAWRDFIATRPRP